MVKDSGHKWGIVKVPIDPKDPSKGVKAVLYDPYYKNLNGQDWNRTDNHANPTRAYWVIPDPNAIGKR